MASVDIKNITTGYGNNIVLRDISLRIEDGESLAIVGPSSCGKTTLMRALCGFNNISEGEIFIGDRLVSSAIKKISVAPEKRNVGVVFQDYAVWPHMTVLENVSYPLKKNKVPKSQIKERAMAAIKQVKMEEYFDRLPGQLSGGQQQRVALARALVSSSDLIVLDEPITNLDATLREEMSYEIQRLQKELGVTIIYITHDQETAMTIADRLAIMDNNGNIQQIGTPEEIWNNPINEYVYKFLGVSNFIPVEYKSGKLNILDSDITMECDLDNLEDGSYMMASRPVDIKLKKVASNQNKFIGIMERVTYLGDQFDYFLKLGDHTIRVFEDSFSAIENGVPEEGERYALDFLHPNFYSRKQTVQDFKEEVL